MLVFLCLLGGNFKCPLLSQKNSDIQEIKLLLLNDCLFIPHKGWENIEKKLAFPFLSWTLRVQ
jgi:hypothetical protein